MSPLIPSYVRGFDKFCNFLSNNPLRNSTFTLLIIASNGNVSKNYYQLIDLFLQLASVEDIHF